MTFNALRKDPRVSRRAVLAGAAGAVATGALADPVRAESKSTPRKQLLLLFLSGGASQFETWDPKPGARTGGPYRAIQTSLTGVRVSELLPHATSSGAPGDSNAILRELLAGGYLGRALVPVVDPDAVAAAFAAGVESTVRVAVGGAFDRRHRPLEITSQVHMLSDGRFQSESFGQEWYSGRTAVLKSGAVTLVVTTARSTCTTGRCSWPTARTPGGSTLSW